MSTVTHRDAGRVSKREFQQRFARRAGVELRLATKVYDAMIEELVDLVGKGHRVTLTGFGKFYVQDHKGHRVQFKKDNPEGGVVPDYAVLKFSSTTDLNKRLKPDTADGDDQ